MQRTIITKRSKRPGKTVAIFGGIHGNEKVGVMLIDKLVKTLKPVSGTVHLVYGNPRAIAKNVRYTETNLNRNFIRTKGLASYEEERAGKLMDLLDGCDALLDLHAYSEPQRKGIPFAICEPQYFPVLKTMPIETVLTGITAFQDGSTNGYMDKQNKIGVVVELGSLERPKEYLGVGERCVLAFLAYFGIVSQPSGAAYAQEILSVDSVYRKNNQNFSFTKKYRSFDTVKKGEMIAVDGQLAVKATKKGKVLFPRESYPVGVESFWFLSKGRRS